MSDKPSILDLAIITNSLILLIWTHTVNAEPEEISPNWNYEARFTGEARKELKLTGTYSYDPHVWVYTSAFAKRFGMPEKWIDDSLKGAEALAYRVDWGYYAPQCGYFGELEKCRPAAACMLDAYIPSSANLPWNNDRRYDSQYGTKSPRFLSSQNQNDLPSMHYRYTQRGPLRMLATFGIDLASVKFDKNKTSGLGNYSLAEYERGLYKNLDYLSGTLSCYFRKTRDAELRIYHPILRENGSINVNQSLQSTAYRIVIPDSFMERVEAYSKKEYEPHSLFNALKQNLKQKDE